MTSVSADEPQGSEVATFRGAGPRAAKATLAGRTKKNPNGVGEAYFYQSSPTDDVLAIVVFASAKGIAGGWDAMVVPAVPLPSSACTLSPANAHIAFNPTGVSLYMLQGKNTTLLWGNIFGPVPEK